VSVERRTAVTRRSGWYYGGTFSAPGSAEGRRGTRGAVIWHRPSSGRPARIRHRDPYRYSKKVLLRAYLDHKRLKSSAELRTDAVPDRPAAADAAELRLTLLDALGQLSPRDRAIIVLRYWEDHSIQTVSELLDLSPGVVKVQSMRALARLRVLLGEDDAPPPLLPEPGARYAIPRPPAAPSRP
jgi:RNA polymerase sigma factor (sigma-70 family)